MQHPGRSLRDRPEARHLVPFISQIRHNATLTRRPELSPKVSGDFFPVRCGNIQILSLNLVKRAAGRGFGPIVRHERFRADAASSRSQEGLKSNVERMYGSIRRGFPLPDRRPTYDPESAGPNRARPDLSAARRGDRKIRAAGYTACEDSLRSPDAYKRKAPPKFGGAFNGSLGYLAEKAGFEPAIPF